MSSGFPQGYFLIKSVAADRVLDVENAADIDGTPVIAWPELEANWVQGFRDPSHDNQLFFVDEAGALSSKASGHAIDIQEGRLVLRRRRPMTHPFPSPRSHPLPRFQFQSSSGQITIKFDSDPSDYFSPPDLDPASYPITLLSRRTHNATQFLANATNLITSPVSAIFSTKPQEPASSITVDDVSTGDFDLLEDEIVDAELAPHEELDDSLEPLRYVHVVGIQPGALLSEKSAARKRWKIIPILNERVRTGSSGR